MGTTYVELLVEAVPEVIENDTQYFRINRQFAALVGMGQRRTSAETKFMNLLGVLIQDYDRRNGLPPDESTPAERLQFLLDHSGKTPADLLSIFGPRSHVSEVLKGKRPISAMQARKLGEMFRMNPGLFI